MAICFLQKDCKNVKPVRGLIDLCNFLLSRDPVPLKCLMLGTEKAVCSRKKLNKIGPAFTEDVDKVLVHKKVTKVSSIRVL